MKKVFIGLFLAVFSLLVLNVTKAAGTTDQLPSNCTAYTDGCNSCGRGATSNQRMCTMMACTDGQTHAPVCTAYATGSVIAEGGLTSGPVSPEYQTSCISGLATVNPNNEGLVGGGMLCFDPAKGKPVCSSQGVSQEGRYYPNGTLLRAMTCPTQSQTACTMIYAPVCASYKPTINCLVAPCPAVDPVVQTYGNKCMMDAAGATYLYDGECNATPEPTVCTDEYDPVCGSVQVECFAAPCPPIPETFSNMCELKKSPRATVLYAGVCKGNLQAGEGTAYNSVSSILDKSYLARQFTPIQASNYTQTIIDKIDHTLQVSRLQKRAYDKYVQLKRFLQLYITLGTK